MFIENQKRNVFSRIRKLFITYARSSLGYKTNQKDTSAIPIAAQRMGSSRKNAPLDPSNVSMGSKLKVWWKCLKGHQWRAIVNNRARLGRGCSFCSGQKVNKENCLQTLNKSLAKQWHPSKNLPLTPSQVTEFSGKKVWWQCDKGHEWLASIAHRSDGRGCPYCAGKKIDNKNNLKAVNPGLSKEWNYEKNYPLTPADAAPNSRKKVWWKCKHGHEWEATIYSRNGGLHGCRYCYGNYASKENNLAKVNPNLGHEWHPTKNKHLTPENVTPYSNKRVWWICRKGHVWNAIINNRQKGTGCPECWAQKRASLKIALQEVRLQ